MLQATKYLICTSLLCSNDPTLCGHVSLNVAAPRPETGVDRTRYRICSCLPFCGSTPSGRSNDHLEVRQHYMDTCLPFPDTWGRCGEWFQCCHITTHDTQQCIKRRRLLLEALCKNVP